MQPGVDVACEQFGLVGQHAIVILPGDLGERADLIVRERPNVVGRLHPCLGGGDMEHQLLATVWSTGIDTDFDLRCGGNEVHLLNFAGFEFLCQIDQ